MAKKTLLTVRQFAKHRGTSMTNIYQLIYTLQKKGIYKHKYFSYQQVGSTYLLTPTKLFIDTFIEKEQPIPVVVYESIDEMDDL